MKTNKDKNEENDENVIRRPQPLVSFDWAIKNILCRKENYDIVEGFLNELLGQPVKIINFLKRKSPDKSSVEEPVSTYMITEDENGDFILIELTFTFQFDYLDNMLYGASKTLVERIDQWDICMPIKKIFSIVMLYFDISDNTDFLYTGKTDFTGVYNKDTFCFTDMQCSKYGEIKVGDIYPQYYILMRNNFRDIPENTLDEWFYFLKYCEIEDNFSAKGLVRARSVLRYNYLQYEERVDYERKAYSVSRQISIMASIIDEAKFKAEEKYRPIIEEINRELEEMDKVIEERNRELEEMDKAIKERNRELEERDKAIEERNMELEERDKVLEDITKEHGEERKVLEELKIVIAKQSQDISENK
jgi:hypothetical protein